MDSASTTAAQGPEAPSGRPVPTGNAHAPSANADERDGSVGGCAVVVFGPVWGAVAAVGRYGGSFSRYRIFGG